MECSKPIKIPRPEGKGPLDLITVPCGRCGQCLTNRRNAWTFRLKEEWRISKSAYFVTLTYSDDCLPKMDYWVDDDNHLVLDVLDKTDVQKFMKRLRKANEKKPIMMTDILTKEYEKWNGIRYYLVGEYGPETYRPHYHAIIFNLFPQIAKKLGHYTDEKTGEVKVNTELQNIWKHGHVDIGEVTIATLHYVTKYFITKISDDPIMQILNDAAPQFTLMSRGGRYGKGIGNSYIERNGVWHIENMDKTLIDEGVKKALPRYYRDRIFDEDQKKELSHETFEKYVKEWTDMVHKYGSKWLKIKLQRLSQQNQNIILNAIKKSKL